MRIEILRSAKLKNDEWMEMSIGFHLCPHTIIMIILIYKNKIIQVVIIIINNNN